MQEFAHETPADQVSRTSTRREHFVTKLLRRGLAVLAIVIGSPLIAQPPRIVAPEDVVVDAGSGSGDEDGLPIRGFMFLDERGNPVFVPSMTWERLRELESGKQTAATTYVFKSLVINGEANDGRAELDLQLRLSIDATGGRLIPIPLQMGNFHLLRAPEFTSSPPGNGSRDIERMTIAPDGEGYVLWVRADKPRETVVKMSVSARADQLSTDSLYFRLPDVPSTINLTIPQANVVGEIDGRSDEVIVAKPVRGGTVLQVKSSGGAFQLRWGPRQQTATAKAQFEVESTINATWDGPQDPPNLAVNWRIRSLRENVSAIDVQMPPGSQLVEDPLLLASRRSASVTKMADDRVRITIPADERRDSLDLSFNITLDNQDVTADGMQNFRVPQVVGALRQEGAIVLKTFGDYRLRWRSSRGVQRVIRETTDDTPNTRSYSFQFDRASFVLPIRLSAQQQKLRIACESNVKLQDSLAILEMTISSRGKATDSRQLEVDFAGWDQQSIVDTQTLETLAIGDPGSTTRISLTRDGGGEPSVIRVSAIRNLELKDDILSFQLPRLVTSDEALLIESNDVIIRNSGRSVLVVDLEQSTALESNTATGGATSDALVSRFRVQPPNAKATVVGTREEQPPQLTLESSANIMLEDDQLVTTADWSITSKSDLMGRLDIDIPQSVSLLSQPPIPTLSELADTTGLGNFLTQADQALDSPSGWLVKVNGRVAALTQVENSRYVLKSDLLGTGTFSIRWTNSRPIAGETIQSVSLPRPRDADVEVRDDITVLLSGNQQTELHAADTPSRPLLTFSEPPREPIRIRLLKRTTSEQELTVRRAVLRTAMGKNTRYEQVLASVQGGDTFRIDLIDAVSNLSAEAYVNDDQVPVRQDMEGLTVQLPGDQESHIVDIRVWFDEPSTGFAPRIKPALRLPVGIGRVYWQIVLPQDTHVVWATSSMGRAMTWQFDRWSLARAPIYTDDTLTEWIGESKKAPMPPGNRYLYVGSDVRSFEAKVASHASIWLIVGGIVLMLSAGLCYLPKLRTPMTAIVCVIAFAGLVAVAPDAAVLAGQFAIMAMVLVIIMLAIRSLLMPRRSARVLTPRSESSRADMSTQTAAKERASVGSSIRSTEPAITTGPSEVAP